MCETDLNYLPLTMQEKVVMDVNVFHLFVVKLSEHTRIVIEYMHIN
jgi:hypothetical protein